MEFNQMIKEFVFNVLLIESSDEKEREKGIEWFERFKKAKEALPMCYHIVSSSFDDTVKMFSVIVIKHHALAVGLDEEGAMKINSILMDLLNKSPNIDLTREICGVFAVLFKRPTIWKGSLSQMLSYILSIKVRSSECGNDSPDDVYLKKAATLFLKELFLDHETFDDCGHDHFRSKISNEVEFLDILIYELVNAFKDDPFLDEVIEVFRLKANVFPNQNIVDCKTFLMICDILRKTDPKEVDRALSCIFTIKTCIKEFELKYNDQTERQYQFFKSLVEDMRKFVDKRKENGNKNLIKYIARIAARLAIQFLETYINSTKDHDFIFCDILSDIGEFNDINFYNEITEFWLVFDDYSDLRDKPKFKQFTDKYCPPLVSQTIKALYICEPLINEHMRDQKNSFVMELRSNMRQILRTVFEYIPIQPYLNDAVSIIKANPLNYSRIETCLFFISTMITDTQFPVDFHEVLEIILDFKPDAPSLLIETCCRFLHDFVVQFPYHKKQSGSPEIGLDSIYKWLSRVPGPATKILVYPNELKDKLNNIIPDFEYINNIIIFCSEISEVENLGKFMADVINNFTVQNDDILIFKGLVSFYRKVLLGDFTNKSNHSDYARLALFMMTAFAKVLDNKKGINMIPGLTATIEMGIDLCFKVIEHLKNNEEVCEKACDALHFIIHDTGGNFLKKEKVSLQLLKLYRISYYSCFLLPFHSLSVAIERNERDWGWFLKHCAVIFENSCNFLSHEDSNDHPCYIERLMKLLQSILERQYHKVLDSIDIGKLVDLACHGLLSQDEMSFNECHKVLGELFTHGHSSIRKKAPETDAIEMRLYYSHIHQIIKNCVDVILKSKTIVCIKGCGNILHIMNVENGYLLPTCLKLEEEYFNQILENYPERIRADKGLSDDLKKIFNASNKEDAEELAISINCNYNR